jgi:hypothetical protein
VGCRNLGRLPQLGFLIFFDKTFLVNLINHNLYGVENFSILNFLGDFFENFSILEVEIGRNGLGILGVKNLEVLQTFNDTNLRILLLHQFSILSVMNTLV